MRLTFRGLLLPQIKRFCVILYIQLLVGLRTYLSDSTGSKTELTNGRGGN